MGLTSLFSFQAVTEAHRSVEDCHERLSEEMIFRSQKVERRLRREEEMEIQRERQRAKESAGRKEGTPTRAYQALEEAVEQREVEEARLQMQKEKDRTRPPSPPRQKEKEKDKTSTGARRNDDTSSRSPSPVSPKAAAK